MFAAPLARPAPTEQCGRILHTMLEIFLKVRILSLALHPPERQDTDDILKQRAEDTTLSEEAQQLVRACVQLRRSEFETEKEKAPEEVVSELKAFLAAPHVRHCKKIWKRMCGADPPRPVLARIAGAMGTKLHKSLGYWNFPGKRAFKREIDCMIAWYKVGRQQSRPRHGLLRTRPGTSRFVRGRAKLWNAKLASHYRRLKGKVRLRGLLAWRTCALAIRKSGIEMQSGTISVERHWAAYKSYFPVQQRSLTLPTFELLSDLAFLRFNWCHYHKPALPSWTFKDPVLAQRSHELLGWLRACQQAEEGPLLAEFKAAWKFVAEKKTIKRRHRR